MATPKRDERGAYALMTAILAIVLISIAALAVDIGNAVARKSDVSGQADFAALDAAAQLTGQTSGAIPSTVLDAVRISMNENQPIDRSGGCTADTACVTSNTQLTNGVLSDGEVRWANGGLQVITPNEKVTYGFAQVMGFNNRNVQGSATVAVYSPLGALPVYAVTPCDYGRQTITDPANGQVPPVTLPTLNADLETNATRLEQPAVPYAVTVNETGHVIVLSGSRWATTQIGFFPASGGAPVIAPAFADPDGTSHYAATPTPYTTTNGQSYNVTFTVPLAVSAIEQVWYIRAFNPASGGKWSAKSEAPTLRVGSPVLECEAGSSDGNFGTLKFPRTDTNSSNDQIAMNMATNIQAPMTITVHSGADSSGLCSEGVSGAVTSALPNPGQQAGTNCVDTDTGLPANAATMGMITGVNATSGFQVGRLRTKSTAPGCGPGGSSSNAAARIQNTTYQINNDVLSCYLLNGKSLADVASPSYSGDAVLDPSIYDSPRFFFVPVLRVDPSSGGSNRYSIIDFRPAFLTDEDVAATSIKGSNSASPGSGNSPGNGITIEQNDIKQMKVIFFNAGALPRRTGGGVTTYFGVGPRIIRLID